MTRTRAREAGLSLVELLIASMVLVGLTGLIVRSITDLSTAQVYTRGQATMAAITDQVARQIEQDVLTASYLYDSTPDGIAYLDSLDVRTPTRLSGSRLPANTTQGFFEVDGAHNDTGNVLLLARPVGTFVAQIPGHTNPPPPPPPSGLLGGLLGGSPPPPPPPPPPTPPKSHRIDLARFVCYYPSLDGAGQLDLHAWVGPVLAKCGDIEALTDDEDRRQAGLKLYEAGIRYAFKVGEPRVRGLFTIRSTGLLLALPLGSRLAVDPGESRFKLLAHRNAELARNGSVPGVKVPKYANANGVFPGGFEVKIDGGSTGRLVLLRLAVMQRKADARVNWAETQKLVNTAQK